MNVLIVVTRMQARTWHGTRTIARTSRDVVADLRTRPGFLGGRLLLDRRRAAWTITAWADRTDLAGFRLAHRPVAARVDELASSSASTAWTAEALPTWAEVGERWPAVPAPAVGLSTTLAPARGLRVASA